MSDDAISRLQSLLDDVYLSWPAARAGMQLVPVLGPAADAFLATQHANSQCRRQDAFFEQLRIGTVRLTRDVVDREPFVRRFLVTLDAARRDLQDEKARLFANLLINGCDDRLLSDDDFVVMLRLVEDLTLREFVILTIIERYEEAEKKPEHAALNPVQSTNQYWVALLDEIAARANVDRDEITALLTRIQRTGLYREIVGTYLNYTGGRGMLTKLWFRFKGYLADPVAREETFHKSSP